MKVIDLINRCLCRDDTLPRKIIYKGKEFALETNIPLPHFYDTDKGVNFMSVIEYFQDLEEEVEIVEFLEEDKEIEELGYFNLCKSNEDREDLQLTYTGVADTFDDVYEKINELIKAVNELKKGK
jgi:hypothetical protein